MMKRKLTWPLLVILTLIAIIITYHLIRNNLHFLYLNNGTYLESQIKNGDFSSIATITDDDTLSKTLARLYELVEGGYLEWIRSDILDSEEYQLILQESVGVNGQMHRIVAIFALDHEKNKSEVVYLHTVSLARFLFKGYSNNLIWYDFSSSATTWESYSKVVFDLNWNMTTLFTIKIELSEDYQDVEFSILRKCNESNTLETLHISEDNFAIYFQSLTGFAFRYVSPTWLQ